jgi:HSP20 family protein
MKHIIPFEEILLKTISENLFPTINSNFNIPIEIEETKDSITIIAEIPGLEKEDINIELKNNFLKISFKKEIKKKDSYSEFKYGEFSRTININDIMKDSIEANYKNGLLEINIKKKKNNIHKINIK